MNLNHLIFPDLLRIIASYTVILVHVTSIGLHDYPIGSHVWSTSLAVNSVTHWAVPVFFMISGMFFLDPERNFSLSKLYHHNIYKIIRCIIFFGIFYSILDQYIYSTISLKSIIIALYGIITANTGYHLWFLYSLVILYISVPLLRLFTERATQTQLKYALVFWFVSSLKDFFPFSMFILGDYAGYFVLGYYLHRYKLALRTKRVFQIMAFFCFITTPILNIILSSSFGLANGSALTNSLGLSSFIIAVSIFISVSQLEHCDFPQKIRTFIYRLSSLSFGVYLTHVFFISLFFRILTSSIPSTLPFFTIFVASTVIYFLSLAVSYVFQLLTKQR